MSKAHILSGDGRGSWRVAFHFDVPDVNNAVGVSVRDLLITSGIGGSTVLPDGDGTGGTIDTGEKAAIVAGEVIEQVVSIKAKRDGTSGPKMRAEIQLQHAIRKAELIREVQTKLRYYGHTEDWV